MRERDTCNTDRLAPGTGGVWWTVAIADVAIAAYVVPHGHMDRHGHHSGESGRPRCAAADYRSDDLD
ncbi:hypothetical protein, partial [Luteitalea sp.]|uniref:hypothetical protein n=1 Tax=Luteitalea sp. TaxID=2004800 RepID=UPI0025C5050A